MKTLSSEQMVAIEAGKTAKEFFCNVGWGVTTVAGSAASAGVAFCCPAAGVCYAAIACATILCC